jgi:anti-sigma B factor antagonist
MNAMDAGKGSSMVTRFGVEVTGSPAAPVVVVRGELDVATSPQLRNQLHSLIARGARDITLEFGGVSFVDSSGLGVLVGTYKRLREEGDRSMRIVGAQPSVRKVFEITGLEAALLVD